MEDLTVLVVAVALSLGLGLTRLRQGYQRS